MCVHHKRYEKYFYFFFILFFMKIMNVHLYDMYFILIMNWYYFLLVFIHVRYYFLFIHNTYVVSWGPKFLPILYIPLKKTTKKLINLNVMILNNFFQLKLNPFTKFQHAHLSCQQFPFQHAVKHKNKIYLWFLLSFFFFFFGSKLSKNGL